MSKCSDTRPLFRTVMILRELIVMVHTSPSCVDVLTSRNLPAKRELTHWVDHLTLEQDNLHQLHLKINGLCNVVFTPQQYGFTQYNNTSLALTIFRSSISSLRSTFVSLSHVIQGIVRCHHT